MFVRVYQYSRNVTRSLLGAAVVAEIAVSGMPTADELEEMRTEYDGDFAEVVDEQ